MRSAGAPDGTMTTYNFGDAVSTRPSASDNNHNIAGTISTAPIKATAICAWADRPAGQQRACSEAKPIPAKPQSERSLQLFAR
jgi:hypothetical protein